MDKITYFEGVNGRYVPVMVDGPIHGDMVPVFVTRTCHGYKQGEVFTTRLHRIVVRTGRGKVRTATEAERYARSTYRDVR